jgi:hypothetical protein
MTLLTTIKVSRGTRDELKEIADREGITLEVTIQRLLKAERQRRIGADLARREITEEDREWIVGSAAAVSRALG